MPKTPQDHKSKDSDGHYQFTVSENGKAQTYSLPPASLGAERLPGKFLRDAYLDSDEGEMRLAFATLEAIGADQAAIDALYTLPAPKMLEHMGLWMNHKASKEDASLGESDSSSD